MLEHVKPVEEENIRREKHRQMGEGNLPFLLLRRNGKRNSPSLLRTANHSNGAAEKHFFDHESIEENFSPRNTFFFFNEQIKEQMIVIRSFPKDEGRRVCVCLSSKIKGKGTRPPCVSVERVLHVFGVIRVFISQ